MAFMDNSQDEMEKILLQLKRHIDMRKQELEHSFEAIFDRLTKKKDQLFQSLDSILTNTKEEIQKKYFEVQDESKHKRATAIGGIFSSQGFGLEDPEQFVTSLNIRDEGKVEIPYVTISKEPLELDFFVENYFQIKIITNPYVYKKHPIWQCSGIKGLSSPKGICVCQFTGAIFIAESGRNCIQVFDKLGSHLKEIRDLKMSDPHYLSINEKHLFVSCWENKALLKLENKSGIRMNYHHAKEHITGITVDTHEDVYVCVLKRNLIVVWDKDFVKRSEIQLDNLFLTEQTQIRDICYMNKIFYILFTDSCFPVQTFNKKGDLVRCLVKESDIKGSKHMAIDQYANILLSDNSENGRNIKIFSNNGEAVHTIQIKVSPGNDKGKGKGKTTFDDIGCDLLGGNIYICDSERMHAY